MVRARSMQEYQDLIQQALFEVKDLRASLEFDEEFMGDPSSFWIRWKPASVNYIAPSRMATIGSPSRTSRL